MVTIVVTNGLLEPLHINAKLPRPLGNARLKGHWWITGIVLAEPNENLEAPNAARRSGLLRSPRTDKPLDYLPGRVVWQE
jgi:hypothetical protein